MPWYSFPAKYLVITNRVLRVHVQRLDIQMESQYWPWEHLSASETEGKMQESCHHNVIIQSKQINNKDKMYKRAFYSNYHIQQCQQMPHKLEKHMYTFG